MADPLAVIEHAEAGCAECGAPVEVAMWCKPCYLATMAREAEAVHMSTNEYIAFLKDILDRHDSRSCKPGEQQI